MNAELPLVAPDVVASAVEGLTSRLRKKLDAAIASYAALPVLADGAVRRVRCGEDAEVALAPGPSGAVTDASQVVCSCLLAPGACTGPPSSVPARWPMRTPIRTPKRGPRTTAPRRRAPRRVPTRPSAPRPPGLPSPRPPPFPGRRPSLFPRHRPAQFPG